MPRKEYHLHDGKNGSALAIRVTPRASKNSIKEIMAGGTIKISLTAPPVDGSANEALVRFLADLLDVSLSKVEIVAGAAGRDKLVVILGMDAQSVQEIIKKKINQ
jgi:uncharacterized protein (TIGR00251 family)